VELTEPGGLDLMTSLHQALKSKPLLQDLPMVVLTFDPKECSSKETNTFSLRPTMPQSTESLDKEELLLANVTLASSSLYMLRRCHLETATTLLKLWPST